MATSIFDRQPWLKDVIMQRIEAQQQAMENANKNANMAPWMPLITAGGLLGGDLIMESVKGSGGLGGLLGLGGSSAATVPSVGISNAASLTASPSILPFVGGAADAGSAATGALGSASGLGSYLIPGVGAVAGGLGLYDAFTGDETKASGGIKGGLGGAALGASIGSVVPGVGTLLGAGVGALAGGGLGGLFGQDKPHPETQQRRDILEQMKQSGFLGANGEVAGGGQIGDPRNPATYNLDPAKNTPDQVMGQTVGMTAPLAAILTNGASPKAREDTTGMLVNAVKDSANPYDRVKELYAKAGLDRNSAYTKIGELASAGKLTEQERDSAFASIDKLFGVRNPNAPKEDQARFDQFQQTRNKPQNLDAWKGAIQTAINPNAPANQQIPVGQPGDVTQTEGEIDPTESALFRYGVPDNVNNRPPMPPLSQKEIAGGLSSFPASTKPMVFQPGQQALNNIDWTQILRRVRGRKTA